MKRTSSLRRTGWPMPNFSMPSIGAPSLFRRFPGSPRVGAHDRQRAWRASTRQRGESAMRVAVFSTKPYDRTFLDRANAAHGHRLDYHEARLTPATAALIGDADAVCPFVNDRVDAAVLRAMAAAGCRLVALRSAGFNNVDLPAARDLGIAVARVPAYSPNAVAEHTAALILTLNRKIHRAYARGREGNFALDGLPAFDLHGQTAGIVGTGQIGLIAARILAGFGRHDRE